MYPLAFLEDFSQINFDSIKSLTLGFVDGHSPSEDQRELKRTFLRTQTIDDIREVVYVPVASAQLTLHSAIQP